MIPAWTLALPTALLLLVLLREGVWHSNSNAWRDLYFQQSDLVDHLDDELSEMKFAKAEAKRKEIETKRANRRAKQDQITEKLRAEVTA